MRDVTVGAQFMQLDKAIAGHGLSAVPKYTQEGNAKESGLFGLKDIAGKITRRSKPAVHKCRRENRRS